MNKSSVLIIIIIAIGVVIGLVLVSGGINNENDNNLTVTYNMNGGTGQIVDSNTYSSGDTVKLIFHPEPKREGYIFAGWSDNQYFGNTYTEPASIVITKKTTLYAQWSEAHHVYYDMSGGKGSIVDDKTYKSGEEALIKFTPEPTKEGYKFIGWTSTKDWKYASYTTPGDKITIYWSDETLYAVWDPIVYYSYNISYATSFTYTITSGSTTYEYEEYAGDGYKFAIAKVTFENLSYTDGFKPGYTVLSLMGTDNIKYSSSIVDSYHYTEYKMKLMNPSDITLFPGTSYTFYILYKVPSSVNVSDLVGYTSSLPEYALVKK